MRRSNNFIEISLVVLVIFKGPEGYGLVIEEEGTAESQPQIASFQSTSQELLCSIGSTCTPISRCEIMFQLMKRSCLQMDKLRGLTCGFKGNEPMVCCPDVCPNRAPVPKIDEEYAESCGRHVGGGVAGSSHPWAVQIGFENKLTNGVEYLCCGSIVSRHVILTAAHCALAKTSTHKIAKVKVGGYGGYGYGASVESSPELPLNHIIVHPGYDASTYRHNIALIVLKSPLNFSRSVQPICVYDKDPINFDSSAYRALLVGWGKLSGQNVQTQIQQQLSLAVQPLSVCVSVYGDQVPVTANELCVGGEKGRDACYGFGGAPLVVVDPFSRDRYFQIGIMSFGSDSCGEQGVPSVYTRVTKYARWIHDNIPKADR